jgi:hypothetical protein
MTFASESSRRHLCNIFLSTCYQSSFVRPLRWPTTGDFRLEQLARQAQHGTQCKAAATMICFLYGGEKTTLPRRSLSPLLTCGPDHSSAETVESG